MKRSPEVARKIEQAIALRAAGHTYQQIADRCGYANRGIAHLTIHRELKRRIDARVDQLRREELEILDALHRQLWPLAFPENGRPSLQAIDRLLAVSRQRIALMGLSLSREKRGEPGSAPVVIVREARRE